MSDRKDLDRLPSSLVLLVDGLCDDFERHWRRAQRRGESPPCPGSFLATAPAEVQPALRRALAELERELLAGGESPGVPGYTFLGEIARGPMGVVYRVRHETDGRVRALKTIVSAELSLWSQSLPAEGHLLTELRHPHIVPVESFGEHDGLPYLVMPLIEGGDLRQRLSEFTLGAGGSTRVSRIASLLCRVSGAVAFLHGRGVLHRDLKPSNILLTPDDEPLVCDFGLALRLGNSAPSLRLVGTLPYMAPEARAGQEATVQSDIWGLGAILHELLAGRPPGPAGELAGLSGGRLAEVCRRCLASNPVERYRSAEELAHDLKDAHPETL